MNTEMSLCRCNLYKRLCNTFHNDPRKLEKTLEPNFELEK